MSLVLEANNPEALLQPNMEVGQYAVGDLLARNSLAEVHYATNMESNEPVALKIALPNGEELMQSEIAIHQKFTNHPHIVTMDASGYWRERPILATRLQENGTLRDASKGSPDDATTVSLVEALGEIEKDIEEFSPKAFDELDAPELLEVVEELHNEGVLPEIVKENETLTGKVIVNAIAKAAKKIVGYEVDPESLLAKEAAKKVIEEDLPAEAVPTVEEIGHRINVVRGTLKALDSMHAMGYVHRDVKRENVAINLQNEGVLIDLGVATRIMESGAALNGSPGYYPPEAITRNAALPAGDVFSTAAMLYKALTNESPWPNATELASDYDSTFVRPQIQNANISDRVAAVIEQGLSLEPEDRPTAIEMHDALK